MALAACAPLAAAGLLLVVLREPAIHPEPTSDDGQPLVLDAPYADARPIGAASRAGSSSRPRG